MASYLKPRRGALSAISSTKLLAGEIFFETTNGVGGGKGRLMMGDGSNTYNNLKSSSKYFLDVDSTPIAFSSLSTSDSTDLRTLGNSIKSNNTTQGTLPHLIRVLQRSLANIEGRLTKLNNDKINKSLSTTSGTITYPFTPTTDCWVYLVIYLSDGMPNETSLKLDGNDIGRLRAMSLPTTYTNCLPGGSIFVPKGSTLTCNNPNYIQAYYINIKE